MATSVAYYGECICTATVKSTGKQCSNNAYWRTNDGTLLCGVHSKRMERHQLPKNPNAAKVKSAKKLDAIKLAEEYAKDNERRGALGNIIAVKMLMRKSPMAEKGYLMVFPNYRHQSRTDGYGCMALSPKAMVNIKHGQPGLPVAKSLENFHQGNKVFPTAVDSRGNPTDEFYSMRLWMYNNDAPLRHNPHATSAEGGNKNVPLYSIWVREDGVEVRMTYFESRQFYCNFYERRAKKTKEFKELTQKIRQGYNLQIVGFDAYQPAAYTVEEFERCYKDTSRPFGHELVLFVMLWFTTRDIPETEYPWRKYKTEKF